MAPGPGLMNECGQAMRAVLPGKAVCRVRSAGCHHVKAYYTHLWCLFPQHGPGRRHERPIRLGPRQQVIVAEHPWEFVRGLMHSDGCRIGVEWKPADQSREAQNVSIAKRASVALMDAHVGPKY